MGYPQQGQPGYQGQPGQPGQYQPQYQQQQGGYAPVHQPAPAAAMGGYNMKRRNPLGVWLGLPMITFGIYSIVWYYKVHNELSNYDRRIPNGSTSALLSLFFGWITLFIWPIIVWFRLGSSIGQAQRAAGLQVTYSGGMSFLLGLLGFGTLYYQMELNKVIDRYGGTPEGAQVPLAA